MLRMDRMYLTSARMIAAQKHGEDVYRLVVSGHLIVGR
jgi:hypothetical protein